MNIGIRKPLDIFVKILFELIALGILVIDLGSGNGALIGTGLIGKSYILNACKICSDHR